MPGATRHILITGASGGLGSALARHYAEPGVRLSLWGRDQRRLEAAAAACRSTGATVQLRRLDLANVPAALGVLAEDDGDLPFDLAILASGQGDIRAAGARVEAAEQVARLGQINFVAPSALAAALADRMATRGHGRIVLVGSAAAFHALPFAAAYAGSKAGLARFADALRIATKLHGVTVTLVSPGFIDTGAGRSTPGPKPFLLPVDRAAALIANAERRGIAHAILPWPFAVIRVLDRLLPTLLRDRLLLALTPPERTPAKP